MKKGSLQTKSTACAVTATLLPISGCSRHYQEFSEPVIVTAMVAFLIGIAAIKSINKVFKIEILRSYLQRSSKFIRYFSILIGAISITLFAIGFNLEDLLFYNSFLGVILLFISNRLYVSATAWSKGDWEEAALNYKLIMFSLTMFSVIFFLIYFGQLAMGF